MELGPIPQAALEKMQGADLVVGVLGAVAGDAKPDATAAALRVAVGELAHSPRIVLVVDDGAGGQRVDDEQTPPVLFLALSDPTATGAAPERSFEGYQAVLEIGGRVSARACGVIAPGLRQVTPGWIRTLVQPALDMQFDLVAPLYARHKWEGLITRSILAPLMRALYGKRIHNPAGPDFALSSNLMQSVLKERRGTQAGGVCSWGGIVSSALRGDFRICEARVGPRQQPPSDWMKLSSLLTGILGPAFLDMERNAADWQRVRGSQPVPAFGEQRQAPEESGVVDVRRLVDSFQLGARDLHDVWSLVLPPKLLLEIRRLARLPPGDFRMADEVWACVVYEFALAHRVRTISRDHLLRSFTPLYLGWIASYAIELANAEPAGAEARLESLARAYESAKPYLVSRWRWPDRFNP